MLARLPWPEPGRWSDAMNVRRRPLAAAVETGIVEIRSGPPPPDSERAYSIEHAMERGLVRYLAAQHRPVPAHLEVEVRECGAHRRAGRTSQGDLILRRQRQPPGLDAYWGVKAEGG